MFQNGSKCQIERVGTVTRLDEEKALLDVNGKSVTVPIIKISPKARVGDKVVWGGNLWVLYNK